MGNNLAELKKFKKILKDRKSVRKYNNTKISSSILEQLIEIGQTGPKAGGIECVEIYVIKEDQEKKICYKAGFYQNFIKEASIVIIVGVNTELLGAKYPDRVDIFGNQNSAIAAQNMIIGASTIGLASCWVGAIRYDYLKENLNFAKYFQPWLMLTIGYENEELT